MIQWGMDNIGMNSEIEQFPAERKRIRGEELPEMFFFDVDEENEEAEFIRVDDLFRTEPEDIPVLSGLASFTLFPEARNVFIGSPLSRLLRRTLILTAARIGIRPEKIRIRPLFVQWQIPLSDSDDPAEIALEFRRDLELQTKIILDLEGTGRFWSNSCLISRAGDELSDDLIVRFAAQIRGE